MSKLYLTAEESRKIDQVAVEVFGYDPLVLMENAGRGTADILCQAGSPVRALMLCGKGNNGGDGFVIARHLAIRGHSVRVLLLGSPTSLRGEALVNYSLLAGTNVTIEHVPDEISTASELHAWLMEHSQGVNYLVDAILGTGASGVPRFPFDAAIEWLNAQPFPKIAVDLPSGMDANTGEALGTCVRADQTCTFVAKKVGFQNPKAVANLGEVHVLDIGIPSEIVAKCFE